MGTEQGSVIIFALTAAISIGVALFLVHVTRLSVRSEAKEREKRRLMNEAAEAEKADNMRKAIFEEIHDVVDSDERSRALSESVTTIFNQELEKRTEKNKQDLSQKYEAVVEEKAQSEQMAWKKYKRVLTDKKETEAVVRSLAQGLLVVDAKGNVVMMNPAAEKLLGASTKDKIGRPVLENLEKEQLVSMVKDSPDQEDREIELTSKADETKKILRASNAVIEDENGKTVGMVSVLSDITKQKELDLLKTAFVANVSHELRTPLVSIEEAVTMMLNKAGGDLTATQEEFLNIAKSNLKRLGLMINDLLDLAKLEAGKVMPKFEMASMADVIGETVRGVSAWANAKHIELEKNIEEGMPNAEIDPNKMIQVMTNLIGNAIKFTPQGGTVTVKARLVRGDNEIEVSVEDTGIGIPPDELPMIFDKFYQSDERTSTDISGTGIGLSISRELVELHDGKIWAESDGSSGTQFMFRLPLTRGR